MRTNDALTAERLRSLLHYDPDTGLFTWKVTRSRTAKAGAAAGNVADGYLKIMVDGVTYRAQRLAVLYMTDRFPTGDVDHRFGDTLDNRWRRLRDVSHATNTENRRRISGLDTTTGLLGVTEHKRVARTWFRARIRVAGRLKSLGLFKTAELAHAAYIRAKREMHPGCTV